MLFTDLLFWDVIYRCTILRYVMYKCTVIRDNVLRKKIAWRKKLFWCLAVLVLRCSEVPTWGQQFKEKMGWVCGVQNHFSLNMLTVILFICILYWLSYPLLDPLLSCLSAVFMTHTELNCHKYIYTY